MPRNKKNKNRAGPPHQQQPAAKPTTPATATAEVIVDVPIAKCDVVVPVVAVPAVAVPAVEVKPVAVTAVEAALVQADKTSDNDDDTAGMSKSQKKKKNKNKNKADKKEDAELLAVVAEVADKVQAKEKNTVVKSEPQNEKPVEIKSETIQIENEQTANKTDVPVQQGKKNKKNKNKGKQNEDNKTEDLKVDEMKKSEETPLADKPKTESNKSDDTFKSDVKKSEDIKMNEEKETEEKSKAKKSDESNKQQVKKSDDKPKGDEKKTEKQLKDDVKQIEEKPKADDKKNDKKQITVVKADEVSKIDDSKHEKITCEDVKKSEVKPNTADIKKDIDLKDDKITNENAKGNPKITQDKGNEKKTRPTESILNEDVKESLTPTSKESHKSDNKLENVKGDTNVKADMKKSDEVKKQDDKIIKNKTDGKKPAVQEIKQKDKKNVTAKPETILECPLEQKVQEIIKETKVDKQVVDADKKPKPLVKLSLESSITQPKEIKPACPILNQNIQSPDIASIWKILDPPKEEVLHQKPIAAHQLTSEVKSTPPVNPTIIKETKKPEEVVETKSIAATLVEALKSETPTKVEIIKSVKDSPEYQTPPPVSSDVNKKPENDTISKAPPKEKCVQEKKAATPIETAISTAKLIEKSAAIVELPKIESKLVNPIVPLVTAAIIGTTTIVAEQCPKVEPIVTKIDNKEAPAKNVASVAKKSNTESKSESNVDVETKTVVTAVPNEKKAEPVTTAAVTSSESPKNVETKLDESSSKTTAVKPEKTTKAKTAATKEKTVKEPKTKTSEKPKDSPDKAPTKEPKTKATKTKAKAPAPPSKDTAAALQDVPLAATLPVEETPLLPATSGAQSQPPIPAPTAPAESKNAAGSDSVQSVDVKAVLGSTAAESLQQAKPQEVNVTADVILSNDVNATFTISAKKASAAPVETKKPTEPKTLPASAGMDATSGAVQLNDILQPNKPAGKETHPVKPGAVVGNVRTKAAPKVPAAKSTGTVPKTTETVPKPKQGSPPKEHAPKTSTPKGKQASPPKDVAPNAAAPTAAKSNARNAKTPPRNASNNTAAAAAAASSNKSRSSPQKEKSPAHSTAKPIVQPRPSNTKPNAAGAHRSASSASSNASNSNSPSPNPPYDDEEYVEFKFSPRPVYMSTICQVCKIPLPSHVHCKLCQMVSYCSVEHLHEDAVAHQPLCAAIQEIAKKRGGHVYNNARILNDDDYRSLRVHTLNLCENALQRHLQPFEREILLFPRLCATGTCREWRQQLLTECKSCGQVSYQSNKTTTNLELRKC